MEKLPASIDWSHIQAFVAVAERGSLSAAARALGVSQPTLGRQIKNLEAELDVTLFHRQARGLTLSETGAALLGPARSMEEAARSISLSAGGRANSLAGTVRLSASLAVSYNFLPPILAELRREEPEIQIELVPTDENLNLHFRECDIALRMVQPQQLDLVARHLGSIELGIYGHRDYVSTLPPLETIEDLLHCDLVGHDRDERIVRGLRSLGTMWTAPRLPPGVTSAMCTMPWFAEAVASALHPDLSRKLTPIWCASHQVFRSHPSMFGSRHTKRCVKVPVFAAFGTSSLRI